MWKVCLGSFLISMASLSAESCPRYVEQGRVLQRFHAEGPTQREQATCRSNCGPSIGLNIGLPCCGPYVEARVGSPCCGPLVETGAGLSRCGPAVGASVGGCSLVEARAQGACCGPAVDARVVGCGSCRDSCCRSSCPPCPPFRPQRASFRPVRGYGTYCATCCRAPIYDESDQEDVFIPEHNAYWPTKRTDSWMRELQW